jgi:nicotinate-nucleotide adenylyltransferase
MRLGVLGGSFNPIHLGHLLVAEDAMAQLKLDRVLFVPTLVPPHKRGPLAPYEDRLAMTGMATASDPRFEASPVEEDLPAPSYTVGTLAELARTHHQDSLYLIVGGDQYAEMGRWHRPEMLTRLARIVVVSRPGVARPRLFNDHDPRRVLFRDVMPVAISAALVRSRLAIGQSVRYMLPVAVSEYIKRHRLYAPRRRTGLSLN